MLKIEYEIKLNESGRPCIDLAKDHEDKPEDKFLAIELARYILQRTLARTSSKIDPETIDKMQITINLLGQVGDEFAAILWESMKLSGDAAFIMYNNYHFRVNSIEERNKIGKYIVTDGKILEKQEGLRVLVIEEMKVFELKGGIANENWIEVK
jgi:hypothetical protein